MRRTAALVILLLIAFQPVSAQSKRAMKYYQEARAALMNDDYPDALKNLDKALDDTPEFIDALLMKADILVKLDAPAESLPLYQKALSLNGPYYVNWFYGQALFEAGKYEEAIQALRAYQQSPRASAKYVERADELIANSEFAIKATADPQPYDPQNLGPAVNTDQMEYFPSISADGNTLVFTHRNFDGEKKDEDFWQTERDSNEAPWEKSAPLTGFLNTPLNEGAQSITSDGRVIFFAACERPEGKGSCDIYASFLRPDGWSKPVNLGDAVNTPAWESQPSISSDGRTLYFVRGQNSIAKNIDIYYSTLGNDGRWAVARPIPGKVNTRSQESSPFIHFDNQSLYFSSNGHPGMGRLDFFVSRRQSDGSWGVPQNLGYPINTSREEFSLIVAPDGKTGYFSSDMEGGLGGPDLYSFELPEEVRAIEIAYIKGRVTNKKTGEPISASIEFSDLGTGKIALTENSGRDGNYFSVLPGNSDYALSIQKKGFLLYSKNFSIHTQSAERAYVLNVELVPIEVGGRVKLENVFFATDSYELDEKSFAELNTIYNFLIQNPDVKISIEGHTDNQGTPAHNKTLSENRARSVYNYLVEKGIEGARLSYKGFGETQAVADNSTEEGRALNRRTEVRITGTGE